MGLDLYMSNFSKLAISVLMDMCSTLQMLICASVQDLSYLSVASTISIP